MLHQVLLVSRTSAPLPYRDGDLLQVTVLELQLAPPPHYSSNPGDYHLPGYNPAQYLELDILQDRPFTLVIFFVHGSWPSRLPSFSLIFYPVSRSFRTQNNIPFSPFLTAGTIPVLGRKARFA